MTATLPTDTPDARPQTRSKLGAVILDTQPRPGDAFVGEVRVYPTTIGGKPATRIRIGGLGATATVFGRDHLTGTVRVVVMDELNEPGQRAIVDTQLRACTSPAAAVVAEGMLRGLAAAYGVTVVNADQADPLRETRAHIHALRDELADVRGQRDDAHVRIVNTRALLVEAEVGNLGDMTVGGLIGEVRNELADKPVKQA